MYLLYFSFFFFGQRWGGELWSASYSKILGVIFTPLNKRQNSHWLQWGRISSSDVSSFLICVCVWHDLCLHIQTMWRSYFCHSHIFFNTCAACSVVKFLFECYTYLYFYNQTYKWSVSYSTHTKFPWILSPLRSTKQQQSYLAFAQGLWQKESALGQ